MDTVIKRLDSYKNSKGLTNKAFAKIIGMTDGAYSNAITRNSNIGVNILENVIMFYPELNLDWLITGRGAMLGVVNNVNSVDVAPELVNCYRLNQTKDLKIEQLEEELRLLKKNVGMGDMELELKK
jgi:transcriptional regulator with XRE-family HTH domain